MLIKSIIDEDFVNYHTASMFIICCYCDWKCCFESNIPLKSCINYSVNHSVNIEFSNKNIYSRYISNPITKAVVIGGFESFLQFDEVLSLLSYFRTQGCQDDFVIYTGYYPSEVQDKIEQLRQFSNVVIKFGRYIPNKPSRHDEILGITLISNNQFAERIS